MAVTVTPQQLIEALRAGDRRALARAITLVENREPAGEAILQSLYPLTGNAFIVGVTGAPGVGKSTLVSALIDAYRQRGARVGVIAVDPSSPFSGGAILGDRIRLAGSRRDEGVYFRSLSNRGQVGGLSRATGDIIHVLDAAGFDVIIVETVGAGQSEVEIMRYAHTVLVLTAPGLGDDVQASKAGILEIGDIFVVNKADREGADRTASELRHMISLAPQGDGDAWKPPVILTVASTGQGIDDLVAAIEQHREYLKDRDTLARRRRQLVERHLGELVSERLLAALQRAAGDRWRPAVDAVVARRRSPADAVRRLLSDVDVLAGLAREAGSGGGDPVEA